MRDTLRPTRHDHVKKGSGDAVINVTCGLLLPSPDAMVASSTGWGEIGRSRESHRGRERERKKDGQRYKPDQAFIPPPISLVQLVNICVADL